MHVGSLGGVRLGRVCANVSATFRSPESWRPRSSWGSAGIQSWEIGGTRASLLIVRESRCARVQPTLYRADCRQGYRTQGRTPYQAFLDGVEAMNETELKPKAA